MSKTNAEQVKAAYALAIAEAIRELKQVPSGHLYASLMAYMSLAQYESIISILIQAGVVEKKASHLLVWIGGDRA